MMKKDSKLKCILLILFLFFLATTSILGDNIKNFFSNNNFGFLNSNSNGEKIFYYENGNIKSKQFYINNKKAGIWEFYDEVGKLKSTVSFTFSLSSTNEEATVINYDSNGILVSTGKILNGQMIDIWKYYDNNGKINHSYNYSTGEITVFNEEEIPILKLEEQYFAEKLQEIQKEIKDDRAKSLEEKEQ